MAETSTIPPKTGPEPLSKEIAECWHRVPDKQLFLLLLSTWLLLFQFLGNSTFGYINSRSLFVWMHVSYTGGNQADDGHGWLIPVVVIVLLWMKRDQFLTMPARPWAPALLLLSLAAVFHFLGYLVQQPRISIIALFLGIYSITGIVWGPGFLRRSFFPMILFVFCVPFGSLAETVTFPLRILVTQISVGIGHHVLGIDVIRNGSQIFSGDQSFQYDVAPACSGIRSLISLSVFSIIYSFLCFKTLWKRALIIGLAVPLAVLGNVIRITTVIVVAEAFGQDAGARIEQNLGFVTFAVAIVTTLGLGYWLRGREAGSRRQRNMTRNRIILLASAMTIMGLTALMLARLQSIQTLGAPGLRTSPGKHAAVLQIELPESSPGYTSEPQKADEADLGILPKDTSIARRLYKGDDGFLCSVSVVMMGTDRTSIHQPKFCLTGQGWHVDRNEETQVTMSQPHTWEMPVMKITATRIFKDEQGHEIPMRALYVYWFVADDLVTSRHWERMWWMAKDLVGRRVLQRWAYVSYFTVCPPGQEEAAYDRIKQLMTATVPTFQLASAKPAGTTGAH